MLQLPTVILRHESRTGAHFDWLMGDPAAAGNPEARLWTARTALPPDAWRAVRTWRLEAIGPHRRAYLSYQGSLTHGRGCVRRVDGGWIVPQLWSRERIVLTLTLRAGAGRIELKRLDGDQWRATWVS